MSDTSDLSDLEWPTIHRKALLNSAGSPTSSEPINSNLPPTPTTHMNSPTSSPAHSQKQRTILKSDSSRSPTFNRIRKVDEEHVTAPYVRPLSDYGSGYRNSPASGTHSLQKKAINVNQNPSMWKRPSPSLNGRSLNSMQNSNPRYQYALANNDFSMGTFLYHHNDYYATPIGMEYDPNMISPRNLVFSPFNSPGPSPGIRFRRIAEDFLDSIPDDSPAFQSRQLDNQNFYAHPHNMKHIPNPKVNSLHGSVLRNEDVENAKGSIDGRSENNTTPSFEGKSSVHTLGNPSSVGKKLEGNTTSQKNDNPWQGLHDDITAFALMCEEDSQKQMPLREELVEFTRSCIRSVWPTAEVDLVGSVAAQVALPKSDLDFVIYFKPSTEAPATRTSTSASVPSLPYIKVDAQTLKPLPMESDNNSSSSSSSSSSSLSREHSPSSRTVVAEMSSTGTPSFSSYHSIGSPVSSLVLSENCENPTSPTNKKPYLYQYFAHASTLIKLIGGRKKSKVLFRSTKIQVFKDINLIRLRDGHSGISTDLWFPVDTAITARSQAHTSLIRSYRTEFTAFYPLACVLKSFMLQNLLNSGYSGLGSYGSLLMLVRFLQHERQLARSENRSEETNLGKLFVGFLRYYIEFDYLHTGISVSGDGSLLDKDKIVLPKKEASKQKVYNAPSDDDNDKDDQPSTPEHSSSRPDSAQDMVKSVEPSLDNSVAESPEQKEQQRISENLTLIIQDPEDTSNQIICHHKALRNMLSAFMRALNILDPSSVPASPLALTVPVAGSTSRVPFVASSQSHDSNVHSGEKSTFHHLIDIEVARQGPVMKPCLSAKCTEYDSQGRAISHTMCPIQNKVCFVCGFMFVKPTDSKQKSSFTANAQNTPSPQKSNDGSSQRYMQQPPQAQAYNSMQQNQSTAFRSSNARNPNNARNAPRNRYAGNKNQNTKPNNYYYSNDQFDVNSLSGSPSYMTILPTYGYSDQYQMPVSMYNMTSYVQNISPKIASPSYGAYVNHPYYSAPDSISPSYGPQFSNFTLLNYGQQGIQSPQPHLQSPVYSEQQQQQQSTFSFRNGNTSRPRPPIPHRDHQSSTMSNGH
jgi:DNA polymerase sigma